MDEAALLATLQVIRTNHIYHAAEVLRRKTSGGALAMASAPENSDERNAVLLLISTWETIALLISGAKNKSNIFEVTPVCHMYRELKDAIDSLDSSIPGLAFNFIKLNAEYKAWLDNQRRDARYVTAACNGLHARFG